MKLLSFAPVVFWITISLAPAGLQIKLATGSQVRSPYSTSDADQDLKKLRFEKLETRIAAMSFGADRDYFSGVLANRSGRIKESIELLERALPRLRPERRQRTSTALATLADDYLKIFRYKEAARIYSRLMADYSDQLDPTSREDTSDDLGVIKLLAEAPGQSITRGGPVRILTSRSPLGTIDVTLTVNHVTGPWILDTGANFSVVSETFAHRLGVRFSTGVAQTKGTVNGAENPLHVGILPEMKLGSTTIRNIVLLILEDKGLLIGAGPGHSYQIEAVLGYPVLQALGTLKFGSDGSFIAGPSPKPDHSSRMFINKLTPLVQASMNGRRLSFAFDTGADGSQFTKRYYEEFPSQFQTVKKVQSEMGGAGGTVKREIYVLPSVTLDVGGQNVRLQNVSVLPFSTGTGLDETYGNLGRDFTKGFDSFTIDFDAMFFALGRPIPN